MSQCTSEIGRYENIRFIRFIRSEPARPRPGVVFRQVSDLCQIALAWRRFRFKEELMDGANEQTRMEARWMDHLGKWLTGRL